MYSGMAEVTQFLAAEKRLEKYSSYQSVQTFCMIPFQHESLNLHLRKPQIVLTTVTLSLLSLQAFLLSLWLCMLTVRYSICRSSGMALDSLAPVSLCNLYCCF